MRCFAQCCCGAVLSLGAGLSAGAQEVPGAALNGDTVILAAAEIKALNSQTLVELLNRIPGVSASDSSVSLQGSSSRHVLVQLDGRPLNDPNTGFVNLAVISLDQIDELQVIKGAGAVQYGDNTSGGVVLITSHEPTQNGVNKIKLQAGSNNAGELSADLVNSIGETGIAMSLGRQSSDGFRINGDSMSHNASLSFSRTYTEVFNGRLSLSYADDDSGYSGRITAPTPNARSGKRNGGTLLNLAYKSLQSRTYYNTFHDEFSDPDSAIENALNSVVAGQEFRRSGDLSLGVKYEFQAANSTQFGKHEENLATAFASKSTSFAGTMSQALSVGLRVNEHSEFGGSWNPQLGWSAGSGPWKFSIESNGSSNTPTFKQRYYESTYTKANPGLTMERASNVKATAAYAPGETLSLSVSAFYNKIDDSITYVRNSDGTYTYRNIASSTRQGVDAGVDWQLAPSAKLNASWLYLDFTDDATGLMMPYKHSHEVKLNLDITAGRSQTTVTGKWVSDSYDDKENTIVLPCYFVMDANMSYRLNGGRLLLRINNLLDAEYEVHSGYPAEGANFMAGFDYAF
jgi:iron complex outermembrane receptor protein